MPADYILINQSGMNLRVDPVGHSHDIDPSAIYALGDLHANALKLLHFLRYIGVAAFPDSTPTSNLWGALNLKTPIDNTWYNLFVAIYDKPASFWNSDNKFVFETFFNALTIKSVPQSRWIGDDLYDRGLSCAFILFFVRKMNAAKAIRKILLSNHGAGFIRIRESLDRKTNPGMNRYSFSDTFFGPEQSASAQGLQRMMDNKAINWAEMSSIYDKDYTDLVALLDIEHSMENDLRIFSHGPINEVDILRAALCLIKPKSGHDTAITSQDERRIRLALSHAKGEKGESLNNTDLVDLKNIVNKAITYHAKNHTLTALLGKELDDYAFGVYFGDGYGKSGTCPFYRTQPLQYILWNRIHPSLNKATSGFAEAKKTYPALVKIVSSCTYSNIHGHVGEAPSWSDEKYINIDSALGSVYPNGARLEKNKRFVLVQSKDMSSLTQVVEQKPRPSAAELVFQLCGILGKTLTSQNIDDITLYVSEINKWDTGWSKHVAAIQRADAAKARILASKNQSLSAYDRFDQCLDALILLVPSNMLKMKSILEARKQAIFKEQADLMETAGRQVTRDYLHNIASAKNQTSDTLGDEQLAPLKSLICEAYITRTALKQDRTNEDLFRAYEKASKALVAQIQKEKKLTNEQKHNFINNIQERLQDLNPVKDKVSSSSSTSKGVNINPLPKFEINAKNTDRFEMGSKGYVSTSTLLTPINAASAAMVLGVLSFTIASLITGDIVGFMGTSHLGYNMLSSLATVLGATAVTFCAVYKAGPLLSPESRGEQHHNRKDLKPTY